MNPLVPVPLDRLTMRLLEKGRAARYATGQEVADALLALLGPGQSSNAAADFAVRMMELDEPARPAPAGTSQSVQTVIAAKPHTVWLMRAAPSDSPSQDRWRVDIAGGIDGPALVDRPIERSEKPAVVVVTPAAAYVDDPPPNRRGLLIGVGAGAAFAVAVAVVLFVLFVLFVVRDPPPPVVVAPVAPVKPIVAAVAPPVVPPPLVPPPTTTTFVEPILVETPPTTTIATTPTTTTATKKTPTTAPAGIRWETSKGKVLGKGGAAVVLPDGTSSVVAVDPVTGGHSVVRVVAGALDYSSLKSGCLVVRAPPYAEVRLGSKALGTTPFDPLGLVEGAYTVELVYEGKIVRRPVTVTAGKETVVAVNMAKE